MPSIPHRKFSVSDRLTEFMKKDSASGIVLVIAAAFAMLLANSPVQGLYHALLNVPLEIRIGALHLAKPLLLWVNDGLMTIFFLVVGLEVKREVLEGELSRPDQIILPAVGALGGMAMPALIYIGLNHGDEAALNGWAIPAATDIAFALGVLALLGRRVPISLRVFLMALAIFDDLGAIIIIALFYTADLSELSLLLAGAATAVLVLLNLLNVTRTSVYVVVGIVLWVAVLKSGVHATLAGVVLGLAIPLRNGEAPDYSPLRRLEYGLHPWVAFAVVPIFAFANAGVSLEGLSFSSLLQPIPLGIAAGLFVGKQLGIMLCCGLIIALGWARLPAGAGWWGFYGVSILCGVGFTMSLFIASLAFEHGSGGVPVSTDRLAILIGSLFSALIGYLVLRFFQPARFRVPV